LLDVLNKLNCHIVDTQGLSLRPSNAIFLAPQADFARLQPTYEAMLKSVQFP